MSWLNETFVYPWVLLGLSVLPVLWWPWLSPRRRAAIRYSSVSGLRRATTTWAARARYLLPALRTLAVMLLIVSVARPRRADRQTRIQTEGIAIQLVVDRSSSMAQLDFLDDAGRPMSRLAAVKQVVKSFVAGDGDVLGGRPDDLIGLIAFAHYSDTECPLTRDHQHLVRAVDRVTIPRTRDEDGTAIGDALMLAVERIRNIGRRLGQSGDFTVQSRVIILLTDGEQNRGKFDPVQAAEVAAAMGVKVYTIGAAPHFKQQTVGGLLFRPQTVQVPVQIDEESLTKVAELTGAKYFRATDTRSLTQIYAEIDQLERTVVDEQRYEVYEELANAWFRLGGLSIPPPLLIALALIALEIILANTRFRKIP